MLPHGNGGLEDEGESPKMREPWGLQLGPGLGMGILREGLGEHPLGTSTQ